MYIRELHIQRFRAFLDLVVRPKGHVVVMGEPGAGRSNLIEALARVLDAEASRTRTTTEFDFYNRDTTHPVQITLTLADIGPDLEQHFFEHLELWDKADDCLIPESDTPDTIDSERYDWVLRLEYRAKWIAEDERCDEWVHYPKQADVDSESFVHAARRDIEKLEFALLHWAGGRILDLSGRSAFRRIIERTTGDDFAAAIAQYVQEVSQAAAQFTDSSQVNAALQEVIGPLLDLPSIQGSNVSGLLQFSPEGGSASGLLRSLGPSIDLGDGAGSLPAWRRGSTTAALFRIAEALALSSRAGRIVAIDDLGDGLDAASAAHLAFVIRRSSGQSWITTRVPFVAEVFDPQEVARLGRGAGAAPFVRQGRQPSTRAETVASKHWHRSILPALSYRSVLVVEGPNDFAALHTLALRLSKERGEPLPATRGIAIINAGSGGSGGYPNVLKLARAAREIGMRAVGVVDGDTRQEARDYLSNNQSMADAVIRLPDNIAIEAALVSGLSDEVLRQAIEDIASSASLAAPQDLDQLSGPELMDAAIRLIKTNALHGLFVDALPSSDLPLLAIELLTQAIQAASSDAAGVVQL